MLLRWWHEGVRDKPFRVVTERLLLAWCAALGWSGRCLTRLWHWLRRVPPPPALTQVAITSILCLRPDRIGDLVLLTPALSALRERFPQAAITLLASEKTRVLVDGHPDVDDVATVPGDRLLDFWRGRVTLHRLRERHFDVIIVFESVWNCAFLAWWLGGRVRVGYDEQGAGFLLTHALPYPYRQEKVHQVVVNAKLVVALGCSEATATGSLHIQVFPSVLEAARRWLEAHDVSSALPLVMIHPGSRARYNQWEPERFGAVAEWLHRETRTRLLILSGPGETAVVRQMRKVLSFEPAIVEGLPLEQVAALMSCCRLFIGNSTGTTHLAAAVGPLTVMIIGGTHPLDCPEHWGPWGGRHLIAHKRPREAIGRDTSRWLGPEGLRHIHPDDVIRLIRPHLSEGLVRHPG